MLRLVSLIPFGILPVFVVLFPQEYWFFLFVIFCRHGAVFCCCIFFGNDSDFVVLTFVNDGVHFVVLFLSRLLLIFVFFILFLSFRSGMSLTCLVLFSLLLMFLGLFSLVTNCLSDLVFRPCPYHLGLNKTACSVVTLTEKNLISIPYSYDNEKVHIC